MFPLDGARGARYWLDPEDSDEWGLVGVGGDLEPSTMVRAYSEGVFAWFNAGDPILWWSPEPRAIIELDALHVSRRLARTMRSGHFRVSFDEAFDAVVDGCADREGGTWITASMKQMYAAMHKLGIAHSVESWVGGELAGGIFGISIGGFFAGESMFTNLTDGSKVAMASLFARLRQQGYALFDTQMCTEHTIRMGAIEIPRSVYLGRLADAVTKRGVRFHP